MTARSKAKKCLANKQNKLNWSEFNFLENLLIFCTLREKVVPKESGVHFRITINNNFNQKQLCLLFEIDRKNDPLIRDQNQLRPDYLCFYVNENTCICTIIEMKGTNKNSTKHGLDQIVIFKKILQEEIAKFLPPQFKIKYQGILLTPYNAQIPNNLITQQAKQGFVILPIQYNEKAELYDYISKLNKLTEKYKHRRIKESRSLLIEKILTQRALPKRLINYSEIDRKTHIYIDYLHDDDSTLITLLANENQIEIRLSGNENQTQIQQIIEILKQDLEGLKLPKIRYNEH